MQYLLPIILTVISYIFGVYFAHQGLRNIMERPLIYKSEALLLILTIVFGWIPVIVAVYLGFKNERNFHYENSDIEIQGG